LAGTALVGCASDPVEIAPQATQQLTTLRDQVIAAKAQIQTTSNAARDLLEQPRQDLTPQTQRLKASVDALNATRAGARQQSAEFQQVTRTYFEKWDDMLKDMSPETAARGKERMSLAKDSVDRLRRDAAAVRAEVNPFMASMNEAMTYLNTDTTAAGLKVVQPQLRAALNREPAILKGLDRLVADIDSIRSGR
jgi:hypothetical protein